MPTIQRIVVIILIPMAMLAGLLVWIFSLGVQKPAEASVPAQVAELGAGWSVHNFRTITFAENNWQQLALEGNCVVYSSLPERDYSSNVRRYIPSAVTVVTSTDDFTLHYPFKGARVIVCAGFTAFLSPLSSGIRRQ